MKRAVAIVLSLILIGIQAMAAVQTSSAPSLAKCGCCTPQKTCCCVEQSKSEAIPLAATPASTSVSLDFTALIPKLLACTLPTTTRVIASSADTAASSLAIPLFQRDCALLI